MSNASTYTVEHHTELHFIGMLLPLARDKLSSLLFPTDGDAEKN
jgi:hypothetical protein